MSINISDELERKFRDEVYNRKGFKKGSITEAMEEAIKKWIVGVFFITSVLTLLIIPTFAQPLSNSSIAILEKLEFCKDFAQERIDENLADTVPCSDFASSDYTNVEEWLVQEYTHYLDSMK